MTAGICGTKSDLTEAEWSEVGPLIPPARPSGNKRTVDIRQVTNGVMYILSTGCQVARHLEGLASEEHGPRVPGPMDPGRHVGAIASRAVCEVPRTGRAGGQPDRGDPRRPEREERGKRWAWIDPHGYDAGKKVKGKKRHVLVDTQGFVLHAIVTAADIQDRDGGAMLLATLFGMFPFLLKLYADGGYQGPEFQKAVKRILPQTEAQIVKRSDRQKGFVVLPRRWVVERTLAWLNRCRRLAKDWENLNLKARVSLLLASIRLMVRRLCRI
jgi:transposase